MNQLFYGDNLPVLREHLSTESAGRLECRWPLEQLPDAIRELVLEDQRLRNEICWSVYDCSWA